MTCASEIPTRSHDLVLECLLDAPSDRLWQLWTDPARMGEWFCPKPSFVTDAVVDLRPGFDEGCNIVADQMEALAPTL